MDNKIPFSVDPIFDAQDYPDHFVSHHTDGNEIIVKGKDWEAFQLKLILKMEKQHWVVDGAGILNVPDENRIKR